MKNGWTTLFRVINVGWNSHIPSLTGPSPSGSANYLKVIAEDGEPYLYPKTLYAPNLAALKTMDIQFTPPADAATKEYQVYDRKLGLANGGGMFRKLNAEVPTTACIPAAISAQPISQSALYGANVNLTVTADPSSTAPVVYQWRKDSVNIPGATSSTLALPAVTTAASGSYDVVVANGCGSVVSQPATLTVICLPTVITGPTPASQTVDPGANATFSVAATGSTPLTYQWRKYSTTSSSSFFTVVGGNSLTLTLPTVTTADAGNYRVLVTDPCGNSTLSANATLTVCASAAITGQPASQTVDHGANATFTVTATGAAPLTYQWRKNTVIIPGATSSTLTLTAVTSAANAGSYDVVVTSPCGPSAVTSATATLAVRPVFVSGRTVITNFSNATGVNNRTTPSIPIDGTGKLLVAAVVYRDTATTPSPSIASVTTVPTGPGAVAQTFTRLATTNWANTQGKLDLWYLVAPNNTPVGGTSPVRVNFAVTTTMEQIAIVVDLFNGVNQATPFGLVTNSYSTSLRTPVRVDPVSTTSDLVINWTGYNSLIPLVNTPITVTDGTVAAPQTLRGVATNLVLTLQSASVRVTSKNGATPTTSMTEGFSVPSTVTMGAVAIKP
jgi:hypothetical protein